jgi:hypothetical protein
MKVLTVKNPWAYLIIHAGKDIENRAYKTNYRGRILIHASKKSDCLDSCSALMSERLPLWKIRAMQQVAETTNGYIIGSVHIVDCVRDSDSQWAEQGMWHWILRHPVTFYKPIPARGMLGLWEYKTEESERTESI